MWEDFLHITKLHHYQRLSKNRIKRVLECLFFCGQIFAASLGYARVEQTVACPVVQPKLGVLSADKIYKNAIVKIEIEEDNEVINLSLYRPNTNGCTKSIFAKYPKEGGLPNVDSIFFIKIKEITNISTIVHWDVNSRGIGTRGKFYQIYSYVSDGLGGLVENKNVSNNSAMSGIDGYQEGRQTSFPYKNADAVRLFFKCKQEQCGP